MSFMDRVLSFKESPAKLSDILSVYFNVDKDAIMNHLTEYEIDSVDAWALDNSLSISDMLDVIQRCLDSDVKLAIKSDDFLDDAAFISSEVFLRDIDRSYILYLVWNLDDYSL